MCQNTENIDYICKKIIFLEMEFAFIILSVISLLMVVVAIAILLGKGDDFIVGYNLASNKTRSWYHERRVRILAAALLLILAVALPLVAALMIKGYKLLVMKYLPLALVLLLISTFIVAHFWVRKKDKK